MILTTGMAHQGKLIELGLVAQLVAANTAAGARVHRDRVDPFKKGGIPAIALYMPDEEVDQDSAQTAPRELKRDADVEMQLFVSGVDAEAVADAMWDLQEQVENAMDGDRYIGGAAGGSILKSSGREIIQTDGRGSDPLVGVVTLTYTVTYRTSPAAPTGLDDFQRVDAKYQLVGGVSDTPVVEDTFTVQEPPP